LRSKFEEQVSKKYPDLEYEKDKLSFTVPAKKRTYNPDWKIRDKVYIETKGKLDRDTTEKMVLVKKQNPDVTIYILFQRGSNKIRRGSKMTYLEWAEKNGFEAACWTASRGEIPKHWLENNNDKTTISDDGEDPTILS
jgi:hypothetical protein